MHSTKVIMLCPEFPPGECYGIGVYSEALASGLLSAGTDLTVITPRPLGHLGEFGHSSIPLRLLPDPGFCPGPWISNVLQMNIFMAGVLGQVVSEIKERAPEARIVVHAQSVMVGWAAMQAKQALGLPTVLTAHTCEGDRLGGGMTPDSQYVGQLERLISASLDRVICVSEHLAGVFATKFPESASRIRIVRPSVDLDESGPASQALDDLEGPVLLFLGRLSPEKGPLDAVKAFAKFHRVEGNGTLVFAGAGPLESEVRRVAAELGVDRHVRLLGFVPRNQVWSIVRRASVTIVPSYYETLSMASVQAVLLGKPVVAYGVGGLPEVLKDAPNCHIVSPGDSEALAVAASVAWQASHTTKETAHPAMKWRWSVPRMVEESIEVYERVREDATVGQTP